MHPEIKEAVDIMKRSCLKISVEDHIHTVYASNVIAIFDASLPIEHEGGLPDAERAWRVYSILWLSVTQSSSGDIQYEFHNSSVPDGPTVRLWHEVIHGPRKPPQLHIVPYGGYRGIHVIISSLSGQHQAVDFFNCIVRPTLEAYGFYASEDFDDDATETDSTVSSCGGLLSREYFEGTDNHLSGKDKRERLSKTSEKMEIDAAQKYEIYYTDSSNYIRDFAKNTILPHAERGVEQTVLVLSGDGGVSDIVNIIQEGASNLQNRNNFKKPSIGVIAMGTGNALANSTGINNDDTHGLRSFLCGSPQPLPVFHVKFSPGSEVLEGITMKDGSNKAATAPPSIPSEGPTLHGCVVCSWGLHASLVADSDTPEYRKHGSERFGMAAQELLNPSDGSASHIYRGKITMLGDGRKHTRPRQILTEEHMYVLATMVSQLQAGFNISPQSKPLDGLMRLVHIRPCPGKMMGELTRMAYKDGSHIEEEGVGYGTIGGLRIDFDEEDGRWRRICVDGTIVKVPEGGWMEVKTCEESFLDVVVMSPLSDTLAAKMKAMTLDAEDMSEHGSGSENGDTLDSKGAKGAASQRAEADSGSS